MAPFGEGREPVFSISLTETELPVLLAILAVQSIYRFI